MRLILLAVLAVALTACDSLKGLLELVDKPTASVAGVAFKDLDLESLTLDFDVAVDNPYTVDIPLVDIGYGLKSQGASILEGVLPGAQNIPAGGTANLIVPAKIRFQDLLSALSGVRPGAVVPWEAALDVKLDIPGLKGYSIPLSTAGNLPIPTVPELQLGGIRWSELSLNRAAAELDLSILNTNDFGFDLNQLAYDLQLGGRKVAKAGVAPGSSFSPGERSSVKIPIEFAPKDLGLALFNVLTGSQAGYAISGNMDLGTEFGRLITPYAKSGVTALFQ